MSSRKPLPDARERQAAVCDLGVNQVVIAGAGTGKTSLLVERALAALATGAVSAGSLVAITFTERAAAQLRERLASSLEDLISILSGAWVPREGAETDAERALAALRAASGGRGPEAAGMASRARLALQQMEDGFIGTIHAFAASMLRRHPREAGVDPYFAVDEGTRLSRLHEEQWPAFLAQGLGEGGRSDAWARALARFEISDLDQLARSALLEWAPVERIEEAGCELDRAATGFREPAESAIARLRPVLAERLNAAPRAWVEKTLEALGKLAESGPAGLSDEGEPQAPPRIGKGFGPSLGEGDVWDRMRHAHRLLRDAARVDPEAVDAALGVILPYVRRARLEARRAGVLPFEALLVLARDLLRDHADLLAEERERIGMLLVDEFQDTDPMQYDIVLLLAGRAGEPGRDPFRAALQPGKLFIVGDPKQSIYRFRGADIEAYSRAVERVLGQGGQRLALSANFRSRPAIIEPLNELFEEAFSRERSSLQAPHEPIEARREESGRPLVTILSVGPATAAQEGRASGKKPPAESQRLREGEVIAEEMRRERRDRNRRWSDMALLLPAMTVGPLYARALRQRRIPFIMEGGRTFGAKPEVRMALSLMRAVASPGEPVDFLAVARSPLGAATDEELARYAAAGFRFPPAGPLDPERAETFPGVARTERLLRDLRALMAPLPVDEAVSLILEKTPILPLAAIAYEGAQRVANLRALVSRAAVLAREEGLSLEATVEALEAEFERMEQGEAPLADEGLDAVRIMTIHKAKGLEFPVVFLADLRREGGRSPSAAGGASLAWRGGPALSLPSGGSAVLSTAEAMRRLEEPRREEAEGVRLLYVACTRAQERLILVQSDPAGGGAWTRELATWGYDCRPASDFPGEGLLAGGGVKHVVVRGPVRCAPEPGEPAGFTAAVEGFDQACALVRSDDQPWIVSPSALHGGEAGDDLAEPEGAVPARGGGGEAAADIASAAGKVLHSLLHAWDRRDPEWLSTGARAYAAAEAALIPLAEEALKALVDGLVETLLGGPLPAMLAGLDLIGREIPLLHPRDGQLLVGRADLVYRDADGSVVVADYKTDVIPEGGSGLLASRYGPQVEAYVAAVRAALPRGARVRGELWLLRAGEVVPVP